MKLNRALLIIAAIGAAATPFALRTPALFAAETTAHQRSQTIEDLAAKLTERFFDPELGQRYAAMLRANAASGKYDSIADDAAFAKQVTADLQAVAFDGHLKLFVGDGSARGRNGRAGPAQSQNIEAAARLTPAIAYLRFGNLFGQPEALDRLRKFLRDNASAKTLIFDMRTNIGGGFDEMDVLFPRIFAKPTVMVAMDTRSAVDANGEAPLGDGPTLRRAAAPSAVVRREHFVTPAPALGNLRKAKIFVLTSGRTASAAEHFTLSLKRTHRATIIGETTYGAGNYGGVVPIAGGFSAFIPVGRTFDPDTGKGWDYVGIAPDVRVDAAQALVEALVRSGVTRAAAERLSKRYGPAPERVAPLRTDRPASVAGI